MALHFTFGNKIPECNLSYFLYNAYSTDKMAYKLDIEKLSNNCSMYLLDKVDNTPTKAIYSCIPFDKLSVLAKESLIKHSLANTAENKKYLLDKLTKIFTEEELYNKFYIYFKSNLLTKKVTSQSWELLAETDNVLEKSNANPDNNKYRSTWLTNHNLSDIMKRYTMLKDRTVYIGVIYLKCFDRIPYKDMINIFESSSLKKVYTDNINDTKYDYIIGHIVSYDHWSALIIDKKYKRVFHFCSGGNNPSEFQYNTNYYFYSTARGFRQNKPDSVSTTRTASKDVLLNYLATKFGFSIFLNVERSQLISGECGIYSTIFMLLFILNDIDTVQNIKALYNSFAFIGDKIAGLYRELLFWREKEITIYTKMISYSRVKDWKLMMKNIADILNKLESKLIREMESLNLKLPQ